MRCQVLHNSCVLWTEFGVKKGLSLASCQVLRKANFAVQCSLLLMVAARSVRVLALWCHPAGVDGSSVPSLWQLPELSWTINNESFGKIVVDHCTFGVARRRWRVPLVLLFTSLPSLNEVVECCPSRFRCQGDHQHHAINFLTTGDAEYIPNELSNLLAHCICSEIGLFFPFLICLSVPLDLYF